MLTYYHGTDSASANTIIQNGEDINRGGGELGKGFYIGSSMWRAFSWAWHKAHNFQPVRVYSVIQYNLDENNLCTLNLLCKNRKSTQRTYRWLRTKHKTSTWTSGHDAIWAPLVGQNIKDTYQIKFESQKGQQYINQQNKQII